MNTEQINELTEKLKQCGYDDADVIANRVFNLGYRKQSDTIKEFAGKLKSIYSGREKRELHTRISFLFDRIDEIAKEYGVEVKE